MSGLHNIIEPDPTDGSPPSQDVSTPDPDGWSQASDRAEYVADMVLELQQMADRSGYATLATILKLAHAEARQLADRT